MTKRDASRAEQVRQRRSVRSAKELEQTTKRALKPMVKVTSRTPSVPIVIVPREKERRRFKIALGLPEFHLKRPKFSMPRFRANWRLASFIIALMLGVALALAFYLPYFYVPSAAVYGNNRITSDEINGVLGIAGNSIFSIQPREMERRLRLNYPELTSANVEVFLPNTVQITVTERQPVILWQQNGGFTWIDTTGVAFRPRGSAEGMVVVTAMDAVPAGTFISNDPYSPPPFLSQELVDAILALSPLVPANTTMTYTVADGLGWIDPRGWRVAFGTTAEDMPLKMRVYQSLVDSLTQRGRTPVFISVVHPDGPFYRMAATVPEETIEENQ
ncbi:MAG: FtsQ-type POTRA domain-containing protein [Anaerolineales bacterium]|nr:FtsQ-type POTRA domain-containing protein [Anaerolineales bacterium]